MTIRQRIDSAARFALFAAVAVSGAREELQPGTAEAEAEDDGKLKAVLKKSKT